MHLKLGDATAYVKEGDKERGYIATCLGGGIEFKDNERDGGRTWFVTLEELWNAFQAGLDARTVEPKA